MNSIKVGIIGGGFGYYGHYKAIKKLKNFDVIAIATNRRIKLNKNIKVYKDPIDLIITEKLDLITVATIPKLQEKLFPYLIKKNCLILLEKPMGINYKKIVKFKPFNKKIGINFTFPEIEEFKYLKRKIISRNLKKITINWKFFSNHTGKNSWKNNPKYGGGIIYNYFSHVLYYIKFIFGKIKKIEKIKKNKNYFKCIITTHTKNKIIFILDTKYNGKPIHEIIIKDQNENILKTNDALRFNNFDLFKNKKKLKLIKNKKKLD